MGNFSVLIEARPFCAFDSAPMDQLKDSGMNLIDMRGSGVEDPKFVEAYYFASLVYWSSYGDVENSINMLKRGILAHPDKAKLPFQIGFIYYVMEQDYLRAAHWFEVAGRCSDATDKESRFAAFARYRAGDDRVSLELWKNLYNSTDSSHMKELAVKMIDKLTRRIEVQKIYGDDFIGPIPEL